MTLSFGLTLGDTGFLYATNSSNVTGWVCDDYFEDVAATAICNSMNGSYWFYGKSQFLTDEYTDFIIDDFICSQSDDIDSHCNWTSNHNCISEEGVFLDCGGPRSRSGPQSFNLSHGDHGILYTSIMNYTGHEQSGFVCTGGFDDMAAEAICTSLFGPNSYWTYLYPFLYYATESDTFHPSDVDMLPTVNLGFNCVGHENIWTNCTFSVDHHCYDLVYLDCGGETLHWLPNDRNSEGFGLTNGSNGILYMHDG